MRLALGIDIGTSKIACALLQAEDCQLVSSATCPTNADCSLPHPFFEQDPKKILVAVYHCLLRIPEQLKAQVCAIGVTGQMHGVILWNDETSDTSNLITWQDGRCNQDGFIEALQSRCQDAGLRSGYGCALLAWLAEHEPEVRSKYARAATIQDYFVAEVCGLSEPLCDPTNAASWGLFDLDQRVFDESKVGNAGFPRNWLPRVVDSGTRAGFLKEEYASRWRLPSGVPVCVAIGDNQASLYGTLDSPHEELALTVGTGAQLSAVVSKFSRLGGSLPPSIEFRPYVQNSLIAVAASLCGGSALHWLKDSIVRFCQDLELPVPDKDTIFKKIDALAAKQSCVTLEMCSSFLGERHDPSLRGSISEIDLSNFCLGQLGAALCRGIVENLRDMMPAEFLRGRTRILGSGNGLRRMQYMQQAVTEVFELPLVVRPEREESALGAAQLALRMDGA